MPEESHGTPDVVRKNWRARCAYAVMVAPNAAVGLTLAAMPPILPELAMRVGGERTAQLIVSVAGFGMIAGGFVSGQLLERAGIRAFTILSLVLYGVLGSAGLYLSGALALGLSRFALGIAGVFFSTSALALTAASFTGEARSRVIGLQQATSQVVNVLAVFIVGALVAVTGWRGAFLLYGAFAALLLGCAIVGIRAAPAAAHEGSRVGPQERPPGFLATIAPVCALTTLMGILTVIPMAQLPFVLTRRGIGSPRQVSLVLAANFLFAALSAASYAGLKRRWGKAPTFMSGLTCGLIGIALMGIVPGLPAQCIAAALAGLGTGIYNTYVFDHGVEISPPVYHGRAAGLLFAFMFFGAAINPLVAGAFEQGLGLLRSFPAMAVVALACGLPVILARRRAAARVG
ncbi:MAG: MFS transporter [Steroidobacteraceae bacterium]